MISGELSWASPYGAALASVCAALLGARALFRSTFERNASDGGTHTTFRQTPNGRLAYAAPWYGTAAAGALGAGAVGTVTIGAALVLFYVVALEALRREERLPGPQAPVGLGINWWGSFGVLGCFALLLLTLVDEPDTRLADVAEIGGFGVVAAAITAYFPFLSYVARGTAVVGVPSKAALGASFTTFVLPIVIAHRGGDGWSIAGASALASLAFAATAEVVRRRLMAGPAPHNGSGRR